jgi:hypothetical protein
LFGVLRDSNLACLAAFSFVERDIVEPAGRDVPLALSNPLLPVVITGIAACCAAQTRAPARR